MNSDRAFRVEALTLADQVAILGGNLDPSLADDETIPTGSLYLGTEGAVWQKWRFPSHWVALSRWSFTFATSRGSAFDYVPISVDGTTLYYILPTDGLIVGVYCQAEKVSKGAVAIELWVGGQFQPLATLNLMESETAVYNSRFSLSTGVAAGEPLQVRMADATGVARDLIVTVLFAHRSNA